MTMRTLMLISALFVGLLTAIPVPFPVSSPNHAFCKTMWIFATPCAEIKTTIIQQIESFNPFLGCYQCQYTLVSAINGTIKAHHTSPDGLQTESIILMLKANGLGGCRVSALSVSLGVTSLVDNGLNYCNLYNLISASGLTSAPGFMEMTNEWACLGYGLAVCKA